MTKMKTLAHAIEVLHAMQELDQLDSAVNTSISEKGI